MKRLIILAAAVLSLSGCDRVRQWLPTQGRAPASASIDQTVIPEICPAYDAQDKALWGEAMAAEATALKATPDRAQRSGSTLTILYAGQPVAAFKGCYAFYLGTVALIDPATGQVTAYPVVFQGGFWRQSVIIKPDGQGVGFAGQIAVSPDHRLIASGDTFAYFNNESLTITDWTSPALDAQVLPVQCSPMTWTAEAGLRVACNRTNGDFAFSEAKVEPVKGGWQLTATKLTSTKPNPSTFDDEPPTDLKDIRVFTSASPTAEESSVNHAFDEGVNEYHRLAKDTATGHQASQN